MIKHSVWIWLSPVLVWVGVFSLFFLTLRLEEMRPQFDMGLHPKISKDGQTASWCSGTQLLELSDSNGDGRSKVDRSFSVHLAPETADEVTSSLRGFARYKKSGFREKWGPWIGTTGPTTYESSHIAVGAGFYSNRLSFRSLAEVEGRPIRVQVGYGSIPAISVWEQYSLQAPADIPPGTVRMLWPDPVMSMTGHQNGDWQVRQ